MTDRELLIPIVKVDRARRRIYGIGTIERPDKVGEIMDYESSKPYIKAWSAEIQKASSGKSQGNVRIMHPKTREKVAVGRVTHLMFDDKAKAVPMTIDIDLDWAFELVEKGTLNGLSMGGHVVGSMWPDSQDPTLRRYTIRPNEVSLVDNAMVPECNGLVVMKADGSWTLVAGETGGEMSDEKKPETPAQPTTAEIVKMAVAEIEKSMASAVDARFKQLEEAVDTMAESVAKMAEATILPAKAATTAVTKSDDGAPKSEAAPKAKEERVPMVGEMPVEKADVLDDIKAAFNQPSAPWFMPKI